MPRRPLVSIVIPFYHSYARYLPECLDSVRRQTYASWEVIVVDDASENDVARQIVDRYADARMTVVRHELNRGQAAARNTGMRLATGSMLMALDCDDLLAPRHVERLVEALERTPECGVAYSDYQLFSAASGVVTYPLRDTRSLLREQWLPHPGTLVRRALWERVGGYCEDPIFRAGNEDWDYWLSLAEVGLRAVRVAEPLYFYRQHEGSITTNQFACADHRMREAMYLRHRDLFDAASMRRTFLAGGCRASGVAYLARGQRRRGLMLLSRAVWLSPIDFARAALKRIRGRVSGSMQPADR